MHIIDDKVDSGLTETNSGPSASLQRSHKMRHTELGSYCKTGSSYKFCSKCFEIQRLDSNK